MRVLPVRGLLPLAAGIVLGFGLAVGGAVLAGLGSPALVREVHDVQLRNDPPLPAAEARVLAEIVARVKSEFVEPVSDQQLMNNAVRGMLTELDPHSQYLDAREYEEIRISTSGSYVGIGVEVQLTGGRIGVLAPIAGTPADRAGIVAGDVVLAIDGEPVNAADLERTIRRMRGRPGSGVRLTVARQGAVAPLDFDLERSMVEVHSVQAQALDDGLAWVRITQFSETTGRDLREQLARLAADRPGGLTGAVLDLRDNPGGVLEAAVAVADAFLESGVIVSARGRTREATFRHEALPGDVLNGTPLVVLVNGGSASASEIVAAALRDNGRAVVAGSRTFGKGFVQTVMPLSGGRAIKLTTSRYFTPSGASIQGAGIAPDITLGVSDREAALQSAVALLRQRVTTPLTLAAQAASGDVPGALASRAD